MTLETSAQENFEIGRGEIKMHCRLFVPPEKAENSDFLWRGLFFKFVVMSKVSVQHSKLNLILDCVKQGGHVFE